MLIHVLQLALPSIKERKAAFDAYCKKAVHTYRPTKLQVCLPPPGPTFRRSNAHTPSLFAMAVAAGALGWQGAIRIAAPRRRTRRTPDAT